ncbi:MAG: NAD+ synthase [Pseudomonadota bacterium]
MTLRIVIAQINLMVGDIEGNRHRIQATAKQARDTLGADLVVFPELTLTGYPPEDLLLRPELIERVERAILALRDSVRGIGMVIGFPQRQDGRLYNAAGLIQNGTIQAVYHKICLPNYSVFDEKRYFSPGVAPCVIEYQGIRLGLTICEDIWEPEPARLTALAGAEVLLNLNASPFHAGKEQTRETLVAQRARDHHLAILYVNLVGGQDELVFDGGSFAMDACGVLRSRCPTFTEDLALVTVSRVEGEIVLTGDTPAAHRPILESVYTALVWGVRDYVTKNGFSGVVLGLSGGIDSALTLAIAVDALDADAVETVAMPSRYTAAISNEDAEAEAKALGVAFQVIPIEPAFQAFLALLGAPGGVTEENLQARCRGMILMARSNQSGRMVLTTGNKSEMAVGYATLYGDMAGGFAPLKDVPKTLVYDLASYRNGLTPVIPRRVIERPPSAELRPDQRDQDSLPPYEILDPILRLYIEEDRSQAEIIAAGFEPATVVRVTRLVDRNEYKRRQSPPGVRITQRAFGRDRRYPITSGF